MKRKSHRKNNDEPRAKNTRNTKNRERMCWSFEVSIATGLWCWGVALFAWIRNGTNRDRWSAIFLATFSSIQFAEAIIWLEIPKGTREAMPCTLANRFLTGYVINVILSMEAIASIVGATLVARVKVPKLFLVTVLAISGWQLMATLCGMLTQSPANDPDFCTDVSPTGHLRWGSRPPPLTMFVLFTVAAVTPFALMKPIRAAVVHAGVFLSTLAYSMTTDSSASMWCFFSCAYSLVIIIDPFLFAKTEAVTKRDL